jgi:hypothetical protein
LEGEAVALTEIAEEAGFFESDPASLREAFETIALEADSIEATAMDVFGMLEEMEGEEGDEVQEVVDDYLGQIDQDHDEIYRAIKKIKRAFRRVVGRRVTREDYQGVHTTSDLVIAAAYAQGAAQKTGDEPVVIVLNTKGLDALADVDVTLEAARTLDDRAIRNEFARRMQSR